jgi:hypothetical protein
MTGRLRNHAIPGTNNATASTIAGDNKTKRVSTGGIGLHVSRARKCRESGAWGFCQ